MDISTDVVHGVVGPSPRRFEDGVLLLYLSKAEDIVRSTVEKYFNRDSTIAPGLLRLHFHDCFVQVSLHLHCSFHLVELLLFTKATLLRLPIASMLAWNIKTFSSLLEHAGKGMVKK